MNWSTFLASESAKPYFQLLQNRIESDRKVQAVFPQKEFVFRAFKETPFEKVSVVILGQDPYHGENQADGLAFSVPAGQKLPPSLRNIYKAISFDVEEFKIPQTGCLKAWAQQGILLLNSVLTVPAQSPQGHAMLGWEQFTNNVLKLLDQSHPEALVFLLWGSQAQEKRAALVNPKHLILTAPHPSPLSAHRGFFTCKHFSKTNSFLMKTGRPPIEWSL